ncbi:MAG: amino acid ABC transporter ATP-binding protein [Planctomycetes bacterium]|nr:amino acid ABC transporter ATP-binding protein [Planctomycetota bacterium]
MIEVKGLVKRFGRAEILSGITLSVAAGEVAAVIGPSGGGKSTFLRCINGLEPFDAGEVRVGEHRLGPHAHDPAMLRAVRRTVGFVFQQFNLFPHLTALGNCIEAPVRVLREPRDAAAARARAMLGRVGLAGREDAYPKDLSGGQQQRVAIARALLMRPQAILFDEPTSALDPVMAAEVLGVMTDLAKEGQTMIVVTHSMHFARSVAGSVHVFAGGRVVESGPPDRVFSDPRHETTRAFLREAGVRGA